MTAIVSQGETAMLEGRAVGNFCPIDFNHIKELRRIILMRGGFPRPKRKTK